MRHFVAMDALDIRGLGEKILETFLQEGIVSEAADLFRIQPGDLGGLEGFGDILSNKLVKEIQEHRKVTLPRFIYALGIRHIGAENALVLARHFKTFDKLREASLEELDSIEGVGDVVAKAIHEFFHNKEEMAKVEHIFEFVHVSHETGGAAHGRLSGTTWVFTGSLESMARDDAKEMVRKLGADVSESVSRKTTHVVVGADPGSKADKAKELGVTILDEKEFLKLVR